MMQQFFGTDFPERKVVVGEGSTLKLGRHTLTFVTAPMVHWPEVIVTYDSTDKVLFSADGFGKFGALDVEEDGQTKPAVTTSASSASTAHRCRRSKKAAALDIAIICPLHGPVFKRKSRLLS